MTDRSWMKYGGVEGEVRLSREGPRRWVGGSGGAGADGGGGGCGGVQGTAMFQA